jgi:hypothetical protein
VQKFLTSGILLLLACVAGYAQILDDSTKQVYGAHTTSWFLFDDVVNNNDHTQSIDTSLLNNHNVNFFFNNGILYQDLGNHGTPLRRVYYEPPTTLGKRLGFSHFNEYGYDPDQIKFYNTRSPYTRLHYIQGSLGQQSMEVEHTRNIKPNWNAGFVFKRMVSLRQLGVSERQEMQQSHYSFAAHTSYTSKNKKLKTLFSFNMMQHSHYDNGGIFVDSTEGKKDMFDYKLERVQLYSLPSSRNTKTKLRTYDKRNNFRIYNQYALIGERTLQVFHQFDYHTNIVRFDDDYLLYNSGYYPAIYFDSSRTNDRIFHELYENKAGVKGALGKLYYQGYLRRKDFSYIQTNYQNVVRRYQENFVGGKAEYRFSDTIRLSFATEYYVGRDYLMKAGFTSQYLRADYQRISYSPTLFQLMNVSNSFQWDNNFANTVADVLQVNGRLKVGNLIFAPFVNLTNINNLIFYNQNMLPEQSNGNIQMLSGGFMARVNWKALYLENYLRYTKTTGADVWRVPALFNQTKLYVYGPLFKKALKLQLGVDLSWKSGYFADSYNPGIQQFYLSDVSNPLNYVDSYLLANLYVNTQIKRAFIFFKFTHLNMGLPEPGYFATPYYTGLPRYFDFGIRWLFYD